MTISRSAPSRGAERWFDRVPLFVILAGVSAALMLIPAIYGAAIEDYRTARPFLYGSITFMSLSLLIGLAVRTVPTANPTRALLLSVLGAYLALPVMLALPLAEAVPGLSFRNAYFEMVSSITTTGATVFDLPTTISPAVHIWRALVGWLGGFLTWVAAISILAPLRLGGFEVVLTSAQLGRDGTLGRAVMTTYPMQRIWRHARSLAPIYGALTLALWLGLIFAGEQPHIAFCHAMSTLATSGISPLPNLDHAAIGVVGELMIFLFMGLALSRNLATRDMPSSAQRRFFQDSEIRLAAVLILTVPMVMFAHHWIATIDLNFVRSAEDTVRAYWGSTFMTMSFLTTTGFISGDWQEAQNWSGLTTPGLILMGLAMVGGGVATTAGGVKLLRVYALYKHGQLEVARLVHPHQVSGTGHKARRFRPEAAYVAWLFFMIFAMSVAAVMVALSAVNVDFERSVVLTVAALTTTGPLAVVAGDAPIALANLDTPAQMILCVAMVMGRLETLAIIALLNRDFWRS